MQFKRPEYTVAHMDGARLLEMGCVAQMVKAKLKGRESLKAEDIDRKVRM